MKIHLRAALLCGVVSLFITGCEYPGMTRESEEDDFFFTGSYTQTVADTPTENEYKWLVKPSIQASNIITSDPSQIDTNDDMNRSFLDASIIYDNGKYGFIDYDGNLILEPAYDYYYICSCGEMILYNVLESDDNKIESCSLNIYGELSYDTAVHEDRSPEYFWDENTQKTYVRNRNENFAKEYIGNETVAAVNTNVIDVGDGNYSVPSNANSFYGLVKNNKVIMDFNYEDYFAPAFRKVNSTGIALKKDGKWGYVSAEGNEVIPFECNDVLSAYYGNLAGESENSHPYLFSGGYVPVSIGSEYYYYDMEGNRVASDTAFEQARPVINGRAWVKCNGKWGVIQLGEIKEIKRLTSTTTKQKTAEKPKKTTTKKEDSSSKSDDSDSSKSETTTKKTTASSKKTTKAAPKTQKAKPQNTAKQTTKATTTKPTTTPKATTTPKPTTTPRATTTTKKLQPPKLPQQLHILKTQLHQIRLNKKRPLIFFHQRPLFYI